MSSPEEAGADLRPWTRAGAGVVTPRGPGLREHLLVALVAAVLSLAPLLMTGGLLRGPRDLPVTGARDELSQYAWVQTLAETGDVVVNPRLGLPAGQDWRHFPQPALAPVTVGLVQVLLRVAPPEEAVALYLALTFFLVAGTAYLALAAGGLPPGWAALGAILFATTPYHFGRGSAHLFQSGYFGIPLLALCGTWLLRGAPGGPSGVRGLLALVASGLLLGGVAPYYTAFALLVLGACTLLGAARAGWRPLLMGGALVGVTLAVAGAAWWHRVGETWPRDLGRLHAESEVYGLKLTSLLVPSPEHRSEAMRALAWRYGKAPLTNENRLNSAGLLGGAGMLLLLGGLLAGGHEDAERRAQGRLLVLVLLLGTVGGLGSSLALGGLTAVRAWNRLSILATFLGLAGLLSFLQERLERASGALTALVAIGLLGLGLWDQVPREPFSRDPEHVAAWREERSAWGRLEEEHPELERLFVLPHRANPEESPARAEEWAAQLRPFLHTERLAFSSGAFRGSPGEARARVLASLPLRPLLHRLKAGDWDGVLVDTEANPGPSPETLAALEEAAPGIDLGRFRVHPLAGCAEACEPEAAGLYLRAGAGLVGGAGSRDGLALVEARGTLWVLHGGEDPRPATLELRARAVGPTGSILRVLVPGKEPVEVPVSATETASEDVFLAVPPDGLRLELETDVAPAREDDRPPERGRRLDLSGSRVVPPEEASGVRELQ